MAETERSADPTGRAAAAVRTLLRQGYIWTGEYWRPPRPDPIARTVCGPDPIAPFVALMRIDAGAAAVLAVMSERRARVLLSAAVFAGYLEAPA